jgi:hypothetical protein
MRRFALIFTAFVVTSPGFAQECPTILGRSFYEECQIRLEIQACEKNFQDDDANLQCQVKAIAKGGDPATIAIRLGQIEQMKKERMQERSNCELGLDSCKPEVAAQIRAEQIERRRTLEREAYCKPTTFVDSNGVTHLKYAHSECGGQLLN